MKAIIRSATFFAVLVPLSGCAADLTMQEVLSKAELENILVEEKIEQVSNIEQQPQDDGTVSLLISSNRRETNFAGCIVNRTDLELRRSGQGWSVSSRSDFVQMALVTCGEAGSTGFASIEGSLSQERIDQSVGYLRQLVGGSLSSKLISGSSDLKDAAKSVDLHEVQAVFVHENGDIEFQVISRAILPRLLGIRLAIEDGRLKRVHLNDENSIEVVEPRQ